MTFVLAQAAPPSAAHAAVVAQPSGAPESSDFPPFDPQFWAPQIIWLALIFGVLYLAMSRIALPRVAGILDTRRRRVATDLDLAEQARHGSEAASAAYDRLLASARARAQAEGHDTHTRLAAESEIRRKALEEQLNVKLAAAERQIEETKSRAMAHVAAIAQENASAIVERLLGRSVGPGASARIVSEPVES